MAQQVHHVERIKFAVSFDVSWANKVGLVNVVNAKRLGKIRILNALWNV